MSRSPQRPRPLTVAERQARHRAKGGAVRPVSDPVGEIAGLLPVLLPEERDRVEELLKVDWLSKTVREAKAFLRAHFDERKAVSCPCCGQRVARDKRSLNSGMARALLWMCRHTSFDPGKWVNIPLDAPDYVTANREYSRLEDWKLIEQQPNTDGAKKTSGIWRLTLRGIEFARGQAQVPKYYFMFDRRIVGWSDDMVTIKQALGKKFDYRDVIGDDDE